MYLAACVRGKAGEERVQIAESVQPGLTAM